MYQESKGYAPTHIYTLDWLNICDHFTGVGGFGHFSFDSEREPKCGCSRLFFLTGRGRPLAYFQWKQLDAV